MEESDIDTWETRRQRLIKLLVDESLVLDMRSILKEFEYTSKNSLINDVQSIAKTLKNEGKTLIVSPSSCIACGYSFQLKRGILKIPSKCPKCRQQRIDWPNMRVI